MTSRLDLPRISIVTATYNAERYVEDTLRSVIEQDYPNLEYIVIDGGSNDGTTQIIDRYGDRISYWTSEPDEGQYNAINKGFEKASGDVLAWLNSDDMYCPWTFRVVGEIFQSLPEVEWLTSGVGMRINSDGLVFRTPKVPPHTRERFFKGWKVGGAPLSQDWITQESTFWRRSLWEKAGGQIDESYSLAADFDLWARFWKLSDLRLVDIPLSLVRVHPDRRSALAYDSYHEEAKRSLASHGGRIMSDKEARIWQRGRKIPFYRRRLIENYHEIRYRQSTGTWHDHRRRTL
jgi:glycosyltransferase involved in cell wall biosynthesis